MLGVRQVRRSQWRINKKQNAEFDTLFNRKPVQLLKNRRYVFHTRSSSNISWVKRSLNL